MSKNIHPYGLMEAQVPKFDRNLVTFRLATATDVDAFIDLERKASDVEIFYALTGRTEVENHLATNAIYFIYYNDLIVGHMEYQLKSFDHAYLNGLVIDPAFQGGGLARIAIEFRLEKLSNMRRIDLVTHPHNSKIIGLYLSYGFIIEAWKDNFFGNGQPRLLLSRTK